MANPNSNSQSGPRQTQTSASSVSQYLDSLPLVQQAKVQWKTYSGQVRPWNDFIDPQRVSRPTNAQQALLRIQHNTNHFLVNYVLIALGLLAIVLLNHLTLLGVAIILLAGFGYIAILPPGSTLRVAGWSLNSRQLYIGWCILSVPLLWWASAGDAFFWWVLLSGSVLAVHAALMEKSVESEFSEQV